MFEFERRWARAVLEGFAPETGKGLAPNEEEIQEIDYLHGIEGFMVAATAKARFGARFALLLLALSPIWMFLRMKTMAGLPRAARAKILHRLLRHPFFLVRELTLLMKVSASFSLLAHPALRLRSGYDGPTLPKAEPIPNKRSLPVVVTKTSSTSIISSPVGETVG